MTTMGPAFDREYALLSKIEALTIERDGYRAAMEQTIVAGERGNDLSGPIHRMRKLLGWPDKGVPARQDDTTSCKPHEWQPLGSGQVCRMCRMTRVLPSSDETKPDGDTLAGSAQFFVEFAAMDFRRGAVLKLEHRGYVRELVKDLEAAFDRYEKRHAASSKTCSCPRPQPRANDPHCMLCNRVVISKENSK